MSREVAKTENVHTHLPVVEMVEFKASVTHTHTIHIYTLSVTHPSEQNTQHLNLSLFLVQCAPLLNTMLLLNSSMILNKEEGSPVILLCLSKIPLEIFPVMSVGMQQGTLCNGNTKSNLS
jgi:hypothetical protein